MLDHLGRSLSQVVKMLPFDLTLVRPPIQLLGKISMDSGKVNSVS
jgi:hypothetical protein